MYNIVIPQRLTDEVIAEFNKEVLDHMNFYLPHEVNFQFEQLEFIEPSGVVTLWNMVDLIEQEYGSTIYYSCPADFERYPRRYAAVDYLDDSLFFQKVMGKKLHRLSKERSTTNGLTKLKKGNFNQQYIDNTISWLKCDVNLKEKSFSFLETALSEVFNNIIDHSGSPIGGCSFAQHYPNKKRIMLSIGDYGVGIANKMKNKFSHDNYGNPLDTDAKLINYATQHKVSTKTTPHNRGLGLENLVKIMEYNKGSMKILSNEGLFVYNGNRKSLQNANGYYQGTLVLLTFRTDTLEVEEEEDLSW